MKKNNENEFLKKEEIDNWQDVIEMPIIKEENPGWKIEELEDVLMASVKNCLDCLDGIENGGIAISLSGGLDSSLLTALARKSFPDTKIITFTLGAKGNPDFLFAKKVAEFLETDHYEYVPSQEEINIVKAEMAEKGLLPKYLVQALTYKFANSLGITKVISAEGGDELFGGYWWHQKSRPQYVEKYGKDQRDAFEKSWSEILYGHLLDYQKSSEAYGIELRFPFLQREVIEYASHIPLEDRCTPSEERYPDQKERKKPERNIALKYLPEEIVYRKKRGFPDALLPEVE